jgi:hypothetical protein
MLVGLVFGAQHGDETDIISPSLKFADSEQMANFWLLQLLATMLYS